MSPKSAGGNGVGNKEVFLMRDEMFLTKLLQQRRNLHAAATEKKSIVSLFYL